MNILLLPAIFIEKVLISRWVRVIATIAFCLPASVAFSQKAWTLQECLSYARKNNLQAQQSALLKDKSLLQLNTARSFFLPEVDMRARTAGNWGFIIDPSTNVLAHQFNLGNQFSLNASLDLFTGFANTNQIKLRKQELTGANYGYEASLNNISLEVAFSYLQVLLAYEQLNNARQQLAHLTNQQKQVAAQVEKEVLHKRDLLNIQSQKTSQELLVVYAENNIDKSTFSLMQVMNLPPAELIRVDTLGIPALQPRAEITLEEVISASESSLPDLKQAQAKVAIAQYSWRIAQASFMPTLSLNAQIGTRTSNYKRENFGSQLQTNLNQQIGLLLYVPIFNRNLFRNNIEVAKLEVVTSKMGYQQVGAELRQRVTSAFLDYKAAFKKHAAVQIQYQAINEEYRYAEKMFRLGSINAVEYGETRARLVSSHSELLQAKYDYLFKQLILEFYQGKSMVF